MARSETRSGSGSAQQQFQADMNRATLAQGANAKERKGMQYTAGQAAEVTGKNIATITRAIKSGKITAHKDSSGAWRIDAAELHRVFPVRAQDLRKTEKQTDARPVQWSSNDQTAALNEELATLRERAAVQYELLEERAGQILDLKEDRDRWRQQATNLLADQRPQLPLESKATSRRRWWSLLWR